MNEEKNIFDDTKIDYSDGIGELLKEKNNYEFSWKKTGTVVVGLTIALTISVAAVSKIAKHLMIPAPDNYQSFEFAEEESTESLAEESESFVEKIEAIEEIVLKEAAQEAVAEAKASQDKSTQATASETRQEKAPTVAKPVVQQTAPAVTSSPKRSLSPDALYRVVIGQFSDRESANVIRKKLRLDKQSSYVWRTREGEQDVYRVQVGAFSKRDLG